MSRIVWHDEIEVRDEPHHAVYFTGMGDDDALAAFVAFRPAEAWGWTWAVFHPHVSLSRQEGIATTLEGAKAAAEAALAVEGLADRVERAP